MTEEMMLRYAIRGVEEELLDWGEKRKAVLCLKKEGEDDAALDKMVAGIDQEMAALKIELDGLKERL